LSIIKTTVDFAETKKERYPMKKQILTFKEVMYNFDTASRETKNFSVSGGG